MSIQLAANWPDMLEKDFSKIYMDQYRSLPAMVPDLFNVMRSDAAFEKSSQVGMVPDFSEFTGKIDAKDPKQGLKVNIIVVLVKLSQMLENLKVSVTDKVTKWKMIEIISRKDFFGGLLASSMVKVG